MWIDRAVRWLLPREDHFFDLLERGADCSRRCADLLADCCREPTAEGREAIVARMIEVEHEGDRVIAEVYEALNKTFVTPIDRADIYTLAAAMEGITDDMFATALQNVVHAMDDLPPGSIELSALIGEAGRAIQEAVGHLRGLKGLGEIRAIRERLKRLESEGDGIYRGRMEAMFRTEADAVRLLKHKEFLEGLERTLDACDRVGNALATIVIKNA